MPCNTATKQTPSSSYQEKINHLKNELAQYSKNNLITFFQLKDFDEILKTTISLCPICLDHTKAVVYTNHEKVFITKLCSSHGLHTAVLENDKNYYYLCNKDEMGKTYSGHHKMTISPYKSCCGPAPTQNSTFADQMMNKSCTILVEITNACNLACKVCYASATGDRVLPFDDFKKYITHLLKEKGELDSAQLTGGEATLHPQFWQMVDFLFKQNNLKKIYIPTNGIHFSNFDFAKKTKPYRKKIIILLQFDGKNTASNLELRNSQMIKVREKTIQNLTKLKIHMQLTMTIAKGINESEIGWVVQQGLKHKSVKVVAMQPVTYSGTFQHDQNALNRLTLSDIIKAIHAQTQYPIAKEVFVPIPCSHPNCGWITVFIQRFGFTKNIVNDVNLNQTNKDTAYKSLLSSKEIRKAVLAKTILKKIAKKFIRSQDSFVIAIKPFMDRHNYDQDRIQNCCHHILNTKGEPVSFCEYNALLRTKDSWQKFPKLK